ncbi:threonine ammonia-lyase [Lacicoccus alkaliphilus]|uniref:threonine ammonia-lyase n=1 Tax=Lacicoccus alkaliphilus DSM 16010 TaxID=1123231 RepID=A0A1M7IYS0_9BACL|nr:threonine/serine dehydratase [Salinicoccus alkaliphilus]SHM45886.1 threonine dehydratase [Salinicoccus alkaliphilus DSM 16010]
MISLSSIYQARDRVKPYVVNTPLVRLQNLDESAGCKVYAKLENMQNTKAFKLRGAMNKILSLTDAEREAGIICSSSGNHGQAVSFAAKLLGIRATVVIPETAPAFKVEAIRKHGAGTEFCTVDDRFIVTENLAREHGYTIVPPFDDELIMAGQGTIGLEIMDEDVPFDHVLVPVSGGGLIGGVSTALKASGFEGRVTGVEPEKLPRYTKSLEAGEPVQVESAKTIADALVVNRPGTSNFEVVQKHVDDVLNVSDETMLRAQKMMLMEGKILAEVSSCIGLGALLDRKLDVSEDETVCLIISGGNLGFEQLELLEDIEY